MAQTTLSVRMDMDVKSQLDALCADVGMTTSTAINMFAKAFIRERRLQSDDSNSHLSFPVAAPASQSHHSHFSKYPAKAG